MADTETGSGSPSRSIVEVLKGLGAGIIAALMALVSGLVAVLGILVAVLPLLLVIGAVVAGVYLIVH
jgi:hypothetical protein